MLLRRAFFKHGVIGVSFDGNSRTVSRVLKLSLTRNIIIMLYRCILIGRIISVMLLLRCLLLVNLNVWRGVSFHVAHKHGLEAGSPLPWHEMPVLLSRNPAIRSSLLFSGDFDGLMRAIIRKMLRILFFSFHFDNIEATAQIRDLEVRPSNWTLILLMLLLKEHALKVE